MKISLSWTLDGKGGNEKNPAWDNIYGHLQQLKDGAGTLSINILNVLDIGPDLLQVRAENNHFMVMLGEVTEDDYNVRVYANGIGDKKIDILGDYWPECQIINDLGLVVNIFKEFFETGNVSMSLLN